MGLHIDIDFTEICHIIHNVIQTQNCPLQTKVLRTLAFLSACQLELLSSHLPFVAFHCSMWPADI